MTFLFLINIKNLDFLFLFLVIDIFALRVGNEKGEDEADTVGTVSLRVEHLKLLSDNKIELNFLGKDSVRYINTFKILPIVYKNLEYFVKFVRRSTHCFSSSLIELYPPT